MSSQSIKSHNGANITSTNSHLRQSKKPARNLGYYRVNYRSRHPIERTAGADLAGLK